jgi:hypothetical protein
VSPGSSWRRSRRCKLRLHPMGLFWAITVITIDIWVIQALWVYQSDQM